MKILMVFLLLSPVSLFADDEVFARQGDTVLTQTELDAAFARIPEIHRLAFIRDGGRVDLLVQNLLRSKRIAEEAKKSGFDQQPLIAARLGLAADKELAETWIQDVMANAPPADYAALAEEYFLANPEEFMTPVMVDVSHILISSENKPETEALELITDLANRLAGDPAVFDDFVTEYSEDPAKTSNNGRYPQMQRGQMVEPFENAAFSLKTAGEISPPVKTTYGYHLIRLNRVIPPEAMKFSDVKPALVEQARNKYLDDYRKNYIINNSTGVIEHPEGAIEAMVKRYFGEDLEHAPDYYDL